MVQFKGELCCMKDNVKDMERSRNVEKNGEKEQGGRRSGKRKDKEQTRKKERAWKNIHVNFLWRLLPPIVKLANKNHMKQVPEK